MTTYYVDGANGNDNNNGQSLAQAWQTIAKANAVLEAGDTLQIKGGGLRCDY